MSKDGLTDYQIARRESFVNYMIKCFGVRWHSVCEKGKIKFMKQIYYDGYNGRDRDER